MVDLERSRSLSSRWIEFLMMVFSKRRTWVSLFLVVYVVLLSSSWNLLLSIRSWPAVYAAAVYGLVFGLLSMGAALSVAVPATVVTWITILVLLAFTGKARTQLVADGRRITADIIGFAFRILLREGNLVAATCAVVSFFALILRRNQQEDF